MTLLFASCINDTTSEPDATNKNGYFSIRDFIADQIKTHFAAPYSFYRISHVKGRTDTTMQNFYNMDWASIIPIFSATDISAKSFLGEYDFAEAYDETIGNRGFTYTARSPKLYTRMLQINTDPTNNRITSIYIETRKSDFWGSKTSKLLYIPVSIIQIQESSRSLLGAARSLRVDYKALNEDEGEEEMPHGEGEIQ